MSSPVNVGDILAGKYQVERVLGTVPGVEAVGGVRIRWVGHELRAEIQIASDPGLSLVDAHTIAEEAHHQLLHEVPRLAEAVIHTNPAGRDGETFHEAVAHHFPRGPGDEPPAADEDHHGRT